MQLSYSTMLHGWEEFPIICFDLFCRNWTSGTKKQAMFLFGVFKKQTENYVDEIEFRGNEQDHRKATFKISAISYNIIGEKI